MNKTLISTFSTSETPFLLPQHPILLPVSLLRCKLHEGEDSLVFSLPGTY